jgi:hypothetical protein
MMSMTSENVNQNANIGGATNSAPQICKRKHHRWLAKRLAYIGLGNYQEVSFFVWSHSTSMEEVQKDTICRRTRQGFIPIGGWDECFLYPVRMVRRRPQRKMSDIWYPSLSLKGDSHE